jgi:hypothetical protein
MNIHAPCRKGWQLARVVAVPVEARTWAKNRPDLIWWASESRFSSLHAGRTSRNTPGTLRSPYQPSPKPSPFTAFLASRLLWLCTIRLCCGVVTNSSRKIGSPR